MASRDDVLVPAGDRLHRPFSLTRDEEQRLRRHSKSIIIKDARSPERLLDEVTLFLHQVEIEPCRRTGSADAARGARPRRPRSRSRRILVVEDDVRNIFALSSVLEPRRARSSPSPATGREALEALERAGSGAAQRCGRLNGAGASGLEQ